VWAERLSVAAEALDGMGCGLDATGNLAWPCLDDQCRCLGIALRDKSGRKFAVPGSKVGLAYPRLRQPTGSTILVVEGQTDVAALLTVGKPAVSRGAAKSTAGQLGWLADYLIRGWVGRSKRIVVIADRDRGGAGLAGAKHAAAVLATNLAVEVPVKFPPAGHKDMRDAILAGAFPAVTRTNTEG
jgi:phage/plasmid primase-like uncharacterized protein